MVEAIDARFFEIASAIPTMPPLNPQGIVLLNWLPAPIEAEEIGHPTGPGPAIRPGEMQRIRFSTPARCDMWALRRDIDIERPPVFRPPG